MGHTFLDRTIALEENAQRLGQAEQRTDFDVDDVTTFVDFHIGGQRDASILLEVSSEEMTRTTTITFGICHWISSIDEI